MEKKDVLSKIGALNKNPEKITNPLFKKHDFFDVLDKIQIKYEMLRANQVDGQKASHICKQYNYSREAFYVILRKFKQKGTVGLLEGSRQKKNTIMMNEDIAKMIIQTKFENPEISGSKLAQKINATFNTDYKKRSIEKAVKSLGLTKKKSNLK